MTENQTTFANWAIIELMGHRRLAGYVQECQIAGAGVLRIDIPGADGVPGVTQYYSPQALYALTPTTEEIARAIAAEQTAGPVQPYEARHIRGLLGEAPRRPVVTDEDTERDDEDDLDDEDAHCDRCNKRLSSDGTCLYCDAL